MVSAARISQPRWFLCGSAGRKEWPLLRPVNPDGYWPSRTPLRVRVSSRREPPEALQALSGSSAGQPPDYPLPSDLNKGIRTGGRHA